MKINFLKLLGLEKKSIKKAAEPDKDILRIWEDDSLMLELLPFENLDFIKSETRRINDFGEQHREESGFTDITEIGKKPVKTIERLIDIEEIGRIMEKVGLQKITEIFKQWEGVLKGEKVPLAYGTNKFAIIIDKKGNIIENISITGSPQTQEDKERLISALLELGQSYNLLVVNWYQGRYFNLIEKSSVEEFIETF